MVVKSRRYPDSSVRDGAWRSGGASRITSFALACDPAALAALVQGLGP